MSVPWAQIVRLMPSILELSHELLKRTRRSPESEPPTPNDAASAVTVLESRILRLEENERRQSELVSNMADQLEQLTTAVTALHRQWRMLLAGQIATCILAVVALALAVRASLAP